MSSAVLSVDKSIVNYEVVKGYAYRLTFDLSCRHFKGNLGRLSVLQNNEEVASKETLTVGSNSIIVYPQGSGEIFLDFKFGGNVDLVEINSIAFTKLESVLELPEDLKHLEIIAAVASIPQRESALKDVLESILPQVDKLFVYLNGYKHVPNFVVNKKIEYVLDPVGRTAAAAKLFWLRQVDGYYFSIDDDIVYPSDYCVKTIEQYKKLKEPCVVSYHGKKYSIFATHQRLDRTKFFQFEKEQLSIKKAHVLGTGVAMLDTRKVKIDLYQEAAKHPRSIDLAVSIALRKAGVSRYTLPKKAGWLKQNDKVSHGLNEFKQIDRSASNDVKGLMSSGLPWLEGKWKYRLFRVLIGRLFWLIPSAKQKKLKKLLRDPKKFFMDSNMPLFKKLFN